MQDHGMPVTGAKRIPWNKGKLPGAKSPLRPKHVWAIRTKLQVEGRKRDLALFNLAVDSKLRGCDIVSIRVEDIAPRGYAIDRASVRQKKTGQPVKFELTEPTRQALDDYLKATGQAAGSILVRWSQNQDLHDNAAVRALTFRMACRGRPGPFAVRYSLP